jgi:hypothetical protein
MELVSPKAILLATLIFKRDKKLHKSLYLTITRLSQKRTKWIFLKAAIT